MSSTNKPFRRFTSLVIRRGRETPYQPWDEDDSLLHGGPAPDTPIKKPAIQFREDSPELELEPKIRFTRATSKPVNGDPIVECFYLGSHNMTGLEIKGRGCIDAPAASIWQQTQDRKPRRKNSWPLRHQYDSTTVTSSAVSSAGCNSSAKPRYVKLLAGQEALLVLDNSSDDLIAEFNYRNISFVGTHPKHNRLFAFIAASKDKTTPYCYAFKCEDKASAHQTACAISDVFQQKIKEILKQKIEVTASATVVS